MTKTDKSGWLKQVINQVAHAAAAFLVVGWAELVGQAAIPVIVGFLIGMALGVVREFTEWQLKPTKTSNPFKGPGSIISAGSLLDYTFWILGGVLAAAIF